MFRSVRFTGLWACAVTLACSSPGTSTNDGSTGSSGAGGSSSGAAVSSGGASSGGTASSATGASGSGASSSPGSGGSTGASHSGSSAALSGGSSGPSSGAASGGTSSVSGTTASSHGDSGPSSGPTASSAGGSGSGPAVSGTTSGTSAGASASAQSGGSSGVSAGGSSAGTSGPSSGGACASPVVLAQRNAGVVAQAPLGPVLTGGFTGLATGTVGPVLTQGVGGRAFGFNVSQNVASVDIQWGALAGTSRLVEVVVGARMFRDFGTFWSRQSFTTHWTATESTVQVRYTPTPPYLTGPITAASASDGAFGVSMSMRSADGQEGDVLVRNVLVRLVLTDGTATEWHSASADVVDPTDQGFSDLDRLAADDGNVTTTVRMPNLTGTALLTATGYGFAVPAAATLTGVELRWVGHASVDWPATPRVVQLVSAGAPLGTNQAPSDAWPQNPPPAPVGGPNHRWGAATLSADDVNREDFGVQVSLFTGGEAGSGTVSVDALTLVVWGCP